MALSPVKEARVSARGTAAPVGRRARRRVETRERIFRAALHLFAERGFTATTVEDITNAADVGKGTFFNYFPGKEHILIEFTRMQAGRVQEFATRNCQADEPVNQTLYRLASLCTGEFDGRPDLVQSLLIPIFSYDSIRQPFIKKIRQDRLAIAKLMSAWQKRGELQKDFSARELARTYQEALFGTVILWSLAPSKPLSRSLREMTETLLEGISRKPRRGQS